MDKEAPAEQPLSKESLSTLKRLRAELIAIDPVERDALKAALDYEIARRKLEDYKPYRKQRIFQQVRPKLIASGYSGLETSSAKQLLVALSGRCTRLDATDWWDGATFMAARPPLFGLDRSGANRQRDNRTHIARGIPSSGRKSRTWGNGFCRRTRSEVGIVQSIAKPA